MSSENPYLEVLDGDMKGTQFHLVGESALIGRSPECDIQLDAKYGISRRHAQIMLMQGKVRVRDLESQNGIMVDGKRVSDAIVPGGSRIKVGQVNMRVVFPSAGGAVAKRESGRVKRPKSERKLPAKGGEKAVAAAPGDEENSLDAESVMAAAGARSGKLLFYLVVLAAAIGGGMYGISVMVNFPMPRVPSYRILQVREEMVVMSGSDFSSHSVVGKTKEGATLVSVSDFKGLLASALDDVNSHNRKIGAPAKKFIVVRGQARGDARIILKDKSGRQVGMSRVLVRGALSPEIPDSLEGEEAKAMVEQLVREADVLDENDDDYAALKKLHLAYLIYMDRLRDTGKANEIRSKQVTLRRDLQKKISKIFVNSLAIAYPDRSTLQRSNLVGAFRGLDEVKRLLGNDLSNLDWQMVNYWQAIIRAELRRQRR